MSVLEAIGFFYLVFATGIFTAALLITIAYVCTVGTKTTWRWIQKGQHQEAEDLEFKRIVRTGQ